jgi:hypothetical protein
VPDPGRIFSMAAHRVINSNGRFVGDDVAGECKLNARRFLSCSCSSSLSIFNRGQHGHGGSHCPASPSVKPRLRRSSALSSPVLALLIVLVLVLVSIFNRGQHGHGGSHCPARPSVKPRIRRSFALLRPRFLS